MSRHSQHRSHVERRQTNGASSRLRKLSAATAAICEKLEERRLFFSDNDSLQGYYVCGGGFAGPADELPPCPDCDSAASGGVPDSATVGDFAEVCSDAPVRYADGMPLITNRDLSSDGMGGTWGLTRSWADRFSGPVGNNWVIEDQPYLIRSNSNTTYIVVRGGTDTLWFDKSGSTYTARTSFKDTMADGASNDIVLTDTYGNKTVFYDFTQTAAGQFKSFTDAGGKSVTTTYSGANLTEVYREDLSTHLKVKEHVTYAYDGNNRVTSASLERKQWDTDLSQTEPGSYTGVRRADYTYYSGDNNGNSGDLRSARIYDPSAEKSVSGITRSGQVATVSLTGHGYKDGDEITISGAAQSEYNGTFTIYGSDANSFKFIVSGSPASGSGTIKSNKAIDTNYYRYYTNSTNGYVGGLKEVFGPDSYARLASSTMSVSLSLSGSTVTVTATGHGLVAGDQITISGANQSEYNGTFAVGTVVDADTLTYTIVGTPASPTGTIALQRPVDRISSAQAQSYANNYFEYDSLTHRATKEIAQGAGCSTCAGGFGTYTFAYTRSSFAGTSGAIDYNQWRGKTTVTLPDGNQDIVYYNEIGQVMLSVHKDTTSGQMWGTFYRYDSSGHVVLKADPSAVDLSAGLSTLEAVTSGDLMDNQSGNYTYLKDSAGVVEITDFATTTFATTSTAGDVSGYKRYTLLQHGDVATTATVNSITRGGTGNLTATVTTSAAHGYSTGDWVEITGATQAAYNGAFKITVTGGTTFTYTMQADPGASASGSVKSMKGALQLVQNYILRTPTGGPTSYPVANQYAFRNESSGEELTSYAYTWQGTTNRIDTKTITHPTVTTAQNGPNSASTDTYVYDAYGRVQWQKDADGYIAYTEYDPATDAVRTRIVDVNTLSVSNEPSGWVTPTGGGLHLTTTRVPDKMGRTTKLTDPNGNVTYTVFNDPDHEERVYPGWSATAGTPTGPTQVIRLDRRGKYTETLTMSAAPATSGSSPNLAPAGTESVGSVQSVSRDYVNNAGQVVETDRYFSLTGTSYSTNAYFGTVNTNYYRTQTDYDSRGRLKRLIDPTGTIQWTVYDVLGRETSRWVGTDDTGFTNSDPGNGGTAPNNMLKVSTSTYDGGQIGDSHLTSVATDPTPASPTSGDERSTLMYYDWRGRPVATKAGAQTTESDTSVQRQTTYSTYDNLGERLTTTTYDSDGTGSTVAITRITEEGGSDTDGVPNAPSDSSLLRSKESVSYDEQGRVYRTDLYSVNPSSGSVSSSSLQANAYYDKRSNMIETVTPGGAVTKYQYDGARRTTRASVTDGGGGTNWSVASNTDSDKVLEQVDITYDANGNPTLTTFKKRFDNATPNGPLGNKDSNNTTVAPARVSYQTAYYDAANRITASVDYGTNGGTLDGTGSGGDLDTDNNFVVDRPSSVPSSSDKVLVTSYAYNVQGLTDTVTDPRGTVSKTEYDLLGRTTKTVAAYVNNSPSTNDDQTTLYTYDGNDHVLTLKADTPGTDQTTQYVYGERASSSTSTSANVPTAGQTTVTVNLTAHGYRVGDQLVVRGASPAGYNGTVTVSAVTSTSQFKYVVTGTPGTLTGTLLVRRAGGVADNNKLELVRYPDKSAGTAGTATTDQESYAYDALGQMTTFTDRNGTVHSYGYDVLGRPTSDAVTTFGSGVDTGVQQLTTSYSSAGLPEVMTSTGSTRSVTTLTRSGTVATATTSGAHGYAIGDIVTVSGASPSGYNGEVTITAVPSTTQFQYTVSSSLGSASGTITAVRYNQVQRVYNGLGQMTSEYQATSGTVHTSSTPKVQYAYTEMAAGANNSRLKSMTYTTGRVVRYEYGTSGGLNDKLSRVSYLADDAGGTVGTHLEEYTYLGLGTVVKQAHPEPNVNLTYIGTAADGGDQYAGLDRFGRVVDQNWQTATPTPTVLDRYKYGYDRDSDVLYKDNQVSSTNSELYHTNGASNGYDLLNRLTAFARGTLSDANSDGTPDTVSTSTASNSWTLDALGNWTATSGQTRTSNAQNQLTATTFTGTPSPTATYTYDSAGGLTGVCTTSWTSSCGGSISTQYWSEQYVYDAWERPVTAVAASCSTSSLTIGYQYDALNRRVARTGGLSDTGIIDLFNGNASRTTVDTRTDLYYSARWQVLDEKAATTTTGYCYVSNGSGGWTQTSSGASTATVDDQDVWGVGYIDDMVLRDRSGTGVVALDTSFNTTGTRTTDFSTHTDTARAVAVQSDGKVVVAGTTVNGASSDLALARYTSTGGLDTTFNTTGQVTTNLGSAEGWGAIDLDADGDILVGGYTTISGGKDFLIARFNSDGSIDTTFSGDGFQETNVAGTDEQVRAVAQLPDGDVIAVGDAVDSGTRKLAVVRYNNDGSLDTAFGTSGIVKLAVGTGAAFGYGLVVQPDGKLVIAGYASFTGNGTDMIAVRLNSNGSLDDGGGGDSTAGDSFGTSGIASVNFNGSGDDHAYGAALSPDGSIVLAGDETDTGVLHMAAVRLTSAGTVDTTFASSGKATAFTSAVSTANAVAVDGLGRVTLAGQVIRTGSEHDFALQRLNADGTVDSTFGSSGAVQTNFATNRDDQAYAVALTAAAGAVAAGSSGGDFAVARYAPGGTASTNRLYALQDANFNVTALISASGSVQQRFVYDPYGASTVLSSSWGAQSDQWEWVYRHQGGRLETATGLYHFRNRDVSATLGRWLQPDPARYIDGANLYQAYVSNPASKVDPLGLCGCDDDDGPFPRSLFTLSLEPEEDEDCPPDITPDISPDIPPPPDPFDLLDPDNSPPPGGHEPDGGPNPWERNRRREDTGLAPHVAGRGGSRGGGNPSTDPHWRPGPRQPQFGNDGSVGWINIPAGDGAYGRIGAGLFDSQPSLEFGAAIGGGERRGPQWDAGFDVTVGADGSYQCRGSFTYRY